MTSSRTARYYRRQCQQAYTHRFADYERGAYAAPERADLERLALLVDPHGETSTLQTGVWSHHLKLPAERDLVMSMTDEEREQRVSRYLAQSGRQLRIARDGWPGYGTLGMYTVLDTHADDFVQRGIKTLDELEDIAT